MNGQKLGLDFGKVIMGATKNGRADTSFLGTTFAEAMKSLPEEGAIESTRQLVELFSGDVWIISKCGPSVENKTKGWLKHWNFYEKTGLSRAKVRFCRKRHHKAGICRQLGITHFVDDRLDVLIPMDGIVSNRYLFGEQRKGTEIPAWATAVGNWRQLLEQFPGSHSVLGP
ncbi:MAG: hypothetical protein AAF358_01510 [Pseudomonadota bacterium]